MVARGLLSVSIGLAIVSQAAPVRADAAEVEALIAKGNELRRAGTPGPALPYFQKAYELARTPRTTGQLGLAELAAGYPVEAEEHLAAALQSPNDPSIVKYRQMLADALKVARAQIGELAVDGGPLGAEVVVDGRVVGVLPLSRAVKLAARNAEVIVRASGCTPYKEAVMIRGGQLHKLTVNLEKEKVDKPETAVVKPAETAVVKPADRPATAPGPAPAVSAPAVVDHPVADGATSGSKLRAAAWITGGAALLAAAAGVALNLAARSNLSDFNGSCSDVPPITAVPGAPLSSNECSGSLRRLAVL